MDFFAIPSHNQTDILKKLDFKEFVRFRKCSNETAGVTKNFKHPLHLKVDIIRLSECSFCFKFGVQPDWSHIEWLLEEPVRLHVAGFSPSGGISDEQLELLKEFCHKTKMVVNVLYAHTNMYDIYLRMADSIITILNPKFLSTWECCSSFLIKLKEIGRFRRINFGWGAMKESDLLLLKNPEIEVDCKPSLSNLSISSVNIFLKQWMKEEREIKHFSINLDELDSNDADPENESEIFKDLEQITLWSPEVRESPFTHFGQYIREVGVVKKIYSLRRSDTKKIFIAIEDIRESLYLTAEEYEGIDDIEKWFRMSLLYH